MTGSPRFPAITRAHKGRETENDPQSVIRHPSHPGLDTQPLHSDTCRHCGQPILTATDLGLTYRCDPTPLTTLGELTAHLQQRYTTAIVTTPNTYELRLRDAHRITTHPDDTVIARHQCHSRPGQQLHDANPQLLHRHDVAQEDTDEPPF